MEKEGEEKEEGRRRRKGRRRRRVSNRHLTANVERARDDSAAIIRFAYRGHPD